MTFPCCDGSSDFQALRTTALMLLLTVALASARKCYQCHGCEEGERGNPVVCSSLQNSCRVSVGEKECRDQEKGLEFNLYASWSGDTSSLSYLCACCVSDVHTRNIATRIYLVPTQNVPIFFHERFCLSQIDYKLKYFDNCMIKSFTKLAIGPTSFSKQLHKNLKVWQLFCFCTRRLFIARVYDMSLTQHAHKLGRLDVRAKRRFGWNAKEVPLKSLLCWQHFWRLQLLV